MELKEEFEQFKNNNQQWLDSDALYEALSEENKDTDWRKWDKLDQCLYDIADNYEIAQQRQERKTQIKQKYNDTIERYKFIQFVASKQLQNTKKLQKNTE